MMRCGGIGTSTTANTMNTTSKENASKAFMSSRRRLRTKNGSLSQVNKASSEDVSSNYIVEKYDLIDLSWTDRISGCPVYHPSNEEFEDPLNYLMKIASEASQYGICKIVSPKTASVPAAEVLRDFEFSTYMQPLQLAEWDMDDKVTFSAGARKYTLNAFKSMADQEFGRRFPHSKYLSPECLEKIFWHAMSSGKEETVEYAINVDGSAFSSDPDDQLGASKWNLKTLPRLSKSILRLIEHEIPGVTCPMLYIGMLFSMFAWHIEDHYLYSMNYHHTGAPKTWYAVPGHAALHFEKLVQDHVYSHNILSVDDKDGVFTELADKTTIFPPSILLQHGVPVYKAIQMPGEFIVTFPRAYHAGFGNGFNCGEAVNFAIGDWFPFGALARKRYARIGIMAILPCEEILCKEITCLSKTVDSEKSSAELSSSHNSVKNSFTQHMRFFNDALLLLENSVVNLRESLMLLPNSHGTIICGTCKRDCYLAFLECNQCYHLLCHFHDIKSLDCPCGGKRILFMRENIWEIEELAQRSEKREILQKVRQENKCWNNSGLPSIAKVSCIKGDECLPHRNVRPNSDDLEREEQDNDRRGTAATKMEGKEDNGDFDMLKINKRAFFDLMGCKRARKNCTLQKTETNKNK